MGPTGTPVDVGRRNMTALKSPARAHCLALCSSAYIPLSTPVGDASDLSNPADSRVTRAEVTARRSCTLVNGTHGAPGTPRRGGMCLTRLGSRIGNFGLVAPHGRGKKASKLLG